MTNEYCFMMCVSPPSQQQQQHMCLLRECVFYMRSQIVPSAAGVVVLLERYLDTRYVYDDVLCVLFT